MYGISRYKKRLMRGSWLFALCAIAAAPAAWAESDGTTQPPLTPFDQKELLHAPFYNERVQSAPAAVRSRLKIIQDNVRQNNYTFSVGYTTAMDKTLKELARRKAPADFLPAAKKQNAFVKEALQLFGEAPDAGGPQAGAGNSAKASACASAKTYDLRTQGLMTPVRDQGNCGSCWDFSAMGAYESAYKLRNKVEIDTSEQYVLSCSGAGNCADGGWETDVLQWMLTHGVPDETVDRYQAKDTRCTSKVKKLLAPYKADLWGYVNAQTPIPKVAEIKQAICDHGAITAAVFVSDAFAAYTAGVFNEKKNDAPNHAIVLAGWDDNKGAWLLKNSWSTEWGQQGYMWIAYGANRVGEAAAWVRAAPKTAAVASTTPGVTSTPLTKLMQKHGMISSADIETTSDQPVPPAQIKD
jgi:C1A family cysteine protease